MTTPSTEVTMIDLLPVLRYGKYQLTEEKFTVSVHWCISKLYLQ